LEPQRRKIGKAAAAAIIAVIIVGTTAAISLETRSRSTSSTSSSTFCLSFPAYISRLTSQVEQTQSFAQASHGFSYVLAYGDNGTETGTASGMPVFYPQETDLTLYSYGSDPVPACPNSDTQGVIGMIQIVVPSYANGSYNFAGMSVYFSPGPLSNYTVLTTTTNSTASIVDFCNQAEGTGLYVTVLSDTGQPIQGANVSGSMTGVVRGSRCNLSTSGRDTNSTGSVLIAPDIGSYESLFVQYQGNIYTANAPIVSMTSTYITIMVPSGNVTVSEVFFGGCRTNTEGVVCPGSLWQGGS
jgi:hypothetical protein